MDTQIIINAKKKFQNYIATNDDIYDLSTHIEELEIWAKKITNKYPQLDKEILLLAIYFHDIGYYPLNPKEDHAITGERIAKKFLEQEKYPEEKIIKTLHAIRSHRCKDIMPESEEARAFAFIDSASHFTDKVYIGMLKDGKGEKALEKMERDFRDLNLFPELKKEMKPIYTAWKSLITNLIKLDKKLK